MNTRFVRTVAFLLNILLLFALIGCATEQAVSPAQSESATSASASSAASTSVAEEPVTLRFWHGKSEIVDSLPVVMNHYTEKNPNVIIECEFMADYYNTLKPYFASGDYPDIYMQAAYSGLTEWIEGGWAMDVTDTGVLSNIEPAFLEATTGADGRVYAVPAEQGVMGIFYNTRIFEKVGITPARTFDEFKDICAKLKDAGYDAPIGTCFMDAVACNHLFSMSMAHAIGGQGYDVMDYLNELTSGTRTWENNPEVARVLEFIDLVKENTYTDTMNTDYQTMCTDFAVEKTPMFVSGIWAMGNIENVDAAMNEYTSMFGVPLHDDPANARLTVNASGGWLIHTKTQYPELVNDVVTWMVSAEGDDLIANNLFFRTCSKNSVAPDMGINIWNEVTKYINDDKIVTRIEQTFTREFNERQGAVVQSYFMQSLDTAGVGSSLQESWVDSIK